MPLFRETTKEDLKKLGLDTDELNTKLAKLDSLPSEDSIVTKVQASMNELITNQFKEMENRLRGGQRTENNNNNNNNENNNNNNNNENDNAVSAVEFLDDPVKFSKRIATEATQDIRLHSVKLAADMAYQQAQNTMPHFAISAIADEIKTEWDKYPPQLKTNPEALIKNLYSMVIGRHIDEIRTDTNKKEGKYNLIQGGGVNRIINNDPIRKPEDLLTPEELKAAASFGYTAQEYAEQKGKLKYA